MMVMMIRPLSVWFLFRTSGNTDWYGDPPEHGNFWENWFFTGKIDHQGHKNPQTYETTCHLGCGTCQNFFSFTFVAVGVTFLKVTFPIAEKSTKSAILDFSGSHFIFVTTSISHIPPPPLLNCTALSINTCRILVQKNVILMCNNVLRLHQPGCVLKRGDWPHCDQGLVLSHVPPSQLYDPSMLTERSRAPGLASAPEKPLQDFTSSPLSAAPGGRGNTFVLREVEHPRWETSYLILVTLMSIKQKEN